MPSKTLVPQASRHPVPALPAKGRRRRVVTWAVPLGTHTLLGDALVWLLGVRRQSDALAIVLRRAMSIDAEDVE